MNNKAELERRAKLLQDAKDNPDLQLYLQEMCRKDIIFWFNNFCWTYDPRLQTAPDLPFVLYPFQEAFVLELKDAIETGTDICIEKSRDMGASWLMILVFQWFWLFYPGSNFHVGSSKEENVDKGYIDPQKTLLGKFRYNLNMLPEWMHPWDWKRYSRFLSVENPLLGNFMTGESQNPNFSRSGRYKAVGLDELAFWDNAEAAVSAAGQSSPCRIIPSTPNGMNNTYYRIMHSPINEMREMVAREEWKPSINKVRRKIRLHWRLHPLKDDAWYEQQKLRETEDTIARELDINYAQSVSGKVFTTFRAHKHVTNTPLVVLRGLPVYRVWDFGKTNAVLYAQIDRMGRVRFLHERILGNPLDGESAQFSTTTEQIEVAEADSNRLFPNCDFIDICDPAGKDPTHNAPPDAAAVAAALGSMPYYETISAMPTKDRTRTGVKKLQELLQKSPGGEEALLIYVSSDGQEGCPILRQAFEGSYRYKKDGNGQTLDRISEIHPYNDIVDCAIYLLLEEGSSPTEDNSSLFEPVYNVFNPI